MTTYYVDGTGGSDSNDGLSVGAPKLNFGSAVGVANNDVVLLKAGSTVHLTANKYPTGNFTLGAYGDGPRPTLAIPGGTYQLAHTGATPGAVYRATGIRFVQSGTAGVSSPFAGGSSVATMIAEDLYIEPGFQHGLRIGNGDNYRARNCVILGSSVSGIHVGRTGQVAPSGGLIEYNTIDVPNATDDGVTLHDGNDNSGSSNVIRYNDIKSGVENCIDVLKCYVGTSVYGNRCEAGANATSTWSVIVMQGSGAVYGNTLIGGPAVAFLVPQDVNGPVDIFSNLALCGAAQQNGTLLRVDGAYAVKFYNNTAICPVDTQRAIVNLNTFPANSLIKNNYIRHGGSAQALYLLGGAVTPAAGSIDGNYYEAAVGTNWLLAGSVDFAAWKSTYSVDAASISSPDAPQISYNYVPLLGSSLIGAGIHTGYKVDMQGKAFYNPPSIGAYEYERPRISRT